MPEPLRNVPSLAAHKLFETSYNFSPDQVDYCLDKLISADIWYDGPRGRWFVSRYDDARSALTHRHLLNNLQFARSSTKTWALFHRLRPSAPSLLFLEHLDEFLEQSRWRRINFDQAADLVPSHVTRHNGWRSISRSDEAELL